MRVCCSVAFTACCIFWWARSSALSSFCLSSAFPKRAICWRSWRMLYRIEWKNEPKLFAPVGGRSCCEWEKLDQEKEKKKQTTTLQRIFEIYSPEICGEYRAIPVSVWNTNAQSVAWVIKAILSLTSRITALKSEWIENIVVFLISLEKLFLASGASDDVRFTIKKSCWRSFVISPIACITLSRYPAFLLDFSFCAN